MGLKVCSNNVFFCRSSKQVLLIEQLQDLTTWWPKIKPGGLMLGQPRICEAANGCYSMDASIAWIKFNEEICKSTLPETNIAPENGGFQ